LGNIYTTDRKDRQLHDEQLHSVYSSTTTIKIKSKKQRTGAHSPQGRGDMYTTRWLESLNGTDHLKHLGVGRRILKWILEK
jgi:hypothetical protein